MGTGAGKLLLDHQASWFCASEIRKRPLATTAAATSRNTHTHMHQNRLTDKCTGRPCLLTNENRTERFGPDDTGEKDGHGDGQR